MPGGGDFMALMPADRPRCYCVLQGGGAKGIAHVGALRALEKANVRFCGYAGTSAGAIVAALATAGYTADNMFGPGGSILDRIDRAPINRTDAAPLDAVRTPPRLLGLSAWFAIRLLRLLLAGWGWFLLAILFLNGGLFYLLGVVSAATAAALQIVSTVALIAIPVLLASGLTRADRLASAINQALLLKTQGRRTGHRVTFEDLRQAGAPPLRIIATNISTRSLKLFSAEETPNVAVADAVAASACLPVIFKPVVIGSEAFYDGGLVSNLPAWTFDAQTAIDRDAWTAVVQLVEDPARARRREGNWIARAFAALLRAPGFAVGRLTHFLSGGSATPWGVGALAAAVEAAAFGAGILEKRGVNRLRSVTLSVDLQTTEFGVSRAKAAAVVALAEEAATKVLVHKIIRLPQQMHDVCRGLADLARDIFSAAREGDGGSPFAGLVRVAMLLPPAGDATALEALFSHGFESFTDERLRVPVETSIAGRAWRLQVPLYGEASDPEWGTLLNRPEDRWVRKLVWSGAVWRLAIPVTHAATGVKMVIVFDSDTLIGVRNIQLVIGLLVSAVGKVINEQVSKDALQYGAADQPPDA